MPRASPPPRHPAHPAASGFAAEEWRLLVQLPAEVMVTTVAAQNGARSPDSPPCPPRRTVAEGLAGLDAIAAGKSSDSDLVRAVVAAIYAEPEPEDGRQHYVADRTRMLDDCRRVASILRSGVDPADAAAYRHWVQQVVVRVCRAARTGAAPALGGSLPEEPAGDRTQRALLDDLSDALG